VKDSTDTTPPGDYVHPMIGDPRRQSDRVMDEGRPAAARAATAATRSPTLRGAQRSGFLAALDAREVAEFTGRCRRLRFARGASITNEGEVSRRVLSLLSGRVKVSSFSDDGRETVLNISGAGDLLGEVSALDGMPCSATVSAMELVEALVLTSADFIDFLDRHPRTSRLLLGSVIGRLREADRKRIEFGVHDTEGRVARRLVEMAEAHGDDVQGGIRITLPLSQQELAGWTCASREAVSKALRNLRARHMVDTQRRSVIILDLPQLRRRGGL
jgi:CRP/FNR family transcriptional regulator, cyclic AMP receptor protein